MRRRRVIPADPFRTIGETCTAIVELIAGALPAFDGDELRRQLMQIVPHLRYLVGTEVTVAEPLTLVAGSLICDIFTIHGEEALEAEEPKIPLGGTDAIEWLLYVPIPEGAPFNAEDLKRAGHQFRPSPASDAEGHEAKEASEDIGPLLDADALRKATGR